MEALGIQAGSCSGSLFYGFDYEEFDMPLEDGVTTGVFGGFTPGGPAMTVTFLDSEGVEQLAEGWAGLSLQEGDTLSLSLRARFHRSTPGFDIEVETGGPGIPGPPDSILFVGNSYTFFNGGLDSIFVELCESADPGSGVTAGMYAMGGYTLQDHYGDPACIDLIERGSWDLVVMQEQSTRPVTDPEMMWEYASLLADVVEGSGARPGFFMTWAREYDPSMTGPLDEAYSHAGALVDGMVSPVGLAWERVREIQPLIDLYDQDGSHPSPAGTYLAACTMYAAVMGESPAGIEYCCDPGLSAEDRLLIQQCSWEAVCEYGQTDWRHF
jgi:hypothetical protein